MKPNRRRSVGPFVGILAALFALSLFAPRAWLRTDEKTLNSAMSDGERETKTLTPALSQGEREYAYRLPTATIPQVAISPAAMLEPTAPPLETEKAFSPPPPVYRISAELASERPAENSFAPAVPNIESPRDHQLTELTAAVEPQRIETPRSETPRSETQRSETQRSETQRNETQRNETQRRESNNDSVAVRPSHPEPAAAMPPLPNVNAPAEGQNIPAPPVDPTADRLPKALLDQLETLGKNPVAAPWSRAIVDRINELVKQPTSGGPTSAKLLGELKQLADQGGPFAQQARDPAVASKIRRAQYGLSKRLDIWERVYRGYLPSSPETIAHTTDQARFATSVAHLEAAPYTAQDGKPLGEYLLLDALKNASRNDASESAASEKGMAERRAIARRVLAKLNQLKPQRRLTERDDRALSALSDEMRSWAAEAVSADQVLAQVERFEQQGDSENGERLAALTRRLILSPDPKAQEVGRELDEHYRNSNLRLALSEKLMNRMVPAAKTTAGDVQDVIQGVPVSGYSQTTTNLQIKLVPDPNYLRMMIAAQGLVDSQTVSSSGPATFHSQGESSFIAQKIIRVGADGIRVKHAAADADSNSTLQAIETSFDNVPLFNSLVRSMARSGYDRKQDDAKAEVEGKVASRAQAQVDAEVDARLAQAEQQFKTKVVNRLAKLELEPQIASLSTTDERVVMRLRLAGEEQLAAYTPRPQAPSDSWASLQIHQSAINNGLLNLRLEGKTFTAQELAVYLADRLDMPKLAEKKDEMPEDVNVTFADRDALMVRCQGGQLVITVGIAELSSGANRFSNFTARIHYKPEPAGLHAGLARDGIIELIGERLNTKSQVALRGVLSKLFSRDRRMQLLPDNWSADPRLAGLAVTQFTIEDGWIGLAVAPTPPGMAPKPPVKRDGDE